MAVLADAPAGGIGHMVTASTTMMDSTRTDTTPQSVSPPTLGAQTPLGAAAPKRRFGRRNTVGLGALMLVGVAAIVASLVQLPYYRISPGSVYDTIERVSAPAERVTIPNGDIGFVTVSQTADISVWQWLDGRLDGDSVIQHEDEINGNQTTEEKREQDQRRMQVSKNAAVIVALQRLGHEPTYEPLGIEVARIIECTAADGVLNTGDVIVGVDDAETLAGEQLLQVLGQHSVGDEIELVVERIDPENSARTLRTDLVGLRLGSADDECLTDEVRADEPRAFIGIETAQMFDEALPFEVDIDTGRVGGPSAGLAFTLAIIDVLSEGELTNGLNVVATGTIDRDGNVGPVGGIHQKTVTAEKNGADVFLVPMCCDNFVDRNTGEPIDRLSNFDEASLYAEDMTVIGVATLDDALRAIGELGGDVDDFLFAAEDDADAGS